MRLGLLLVFFLFLKLLGYSQGAKDISLLYNWRNDSLTASDAHANKYNEVWGVAQNGKEYAIIGSTWGTHIIDVSDPVNSHEVIAVKGEFSSPEVVHRDYHDYKGYLYIVGGTNGIAFRESGTNRAFITGSGHFEPGANNTYDLGTCDLLRLPKH